MHCAAGAAGDGVRGCLHHLHLAAHVCQPSSLEEVCHPGLQGSNCARCRLCCSRPAAGGPTAASHCSGWSADQSPPGSWLCPQGGRAGTCPTQTADMPWAGGPLSQTAAASTASAHHQPCVRREVWGSGKQGATTDLCAFVSHLELVEAGALDILHPCGAEHRSSLSQRQAPTPRPPFAGCVGGVTPRPSAARAQELNGRPGENTEGKEHKQRDEKSRERKRRTEVEAKKGEVKER
jgi:hypothetical protein